MKILKSLALGLLSFLLFVSLSGFGLALTANATALSPRFVSTQTDRLDLPSLVDQSLSSTDQASFSPEVRSTAVALVASLQAQIKAQLNAAISDTYDYLLGRSQSIDVSSVLKNTVLSESLVTSPAVQDNITAAAQSSIRDQLVALIPPGQQQLTSYVDQAMPSIQPWLRQQVSGATGPVVDYLAGNSQTLDVVIPLDQMKTILKGSLYQAFMSSPPTVLAGASTAELDAIFNTAYAAFSAQIPSSFVIDPESLGLNGPLISQQEAANANTWLAEARTSIGHFRLYYVLLIVLMVLLVGGIMLIHRSVEGATMELGVTFVTYGVLEIIGIVVSRALIDAAMRKADIPATLTWLRGWLSALVGDAVRPLEIFSIGLAVAGIALIVVSVVYRRRSAAG